MSGNCANRFFVCGKWVMAKIPAFESHVLPIAQVMKALKGKNWKAKKLKKNPTRWLGSH